MQAVLRALPVAGRYAAAFKMLFWTAGRLGEVVNARWRDVDFQSGIWTVPVTKTDKRHTVPLPRQALDMLRVLQRVGDRHAGDLIFPAIEGGALTRWDNATRRVQTASGTKDWHRHDVRRSVASIMGDLGIAPHIVEVALGHTLSHSSDGQKIGGNATTYNVSRYRKEHAEALQALADALDRIEAGAGANVIPLHGKA
jgi:integrase